MPDPIDQLKDELAPIEDLKNAAEVLSWDQETFMPDGGAEARARQIATLRTMAHERFVTDEMGALIDRADDALNGADAEAGALIRVTRRDYTRARKIPSSLVSELSEASSRAQVAWQKAREDNDFDAFAPHLQRLVELNVEKAEALGYDDEPYDALLDEYEPGARTTDIAPRIGLTSASTQNVAAATISSPARTVSFPTASSAASRSTTAGSGESALRIPGPSILKRTLRVGRCRPGR